MTSFGEDVHGEVYVCLNSTVSKITSPDCEPVAVILSDSVIAACPGNIVTLGAVEGPGLSYQWLQNGNALVGDTASQLIVTDTAVYSVVVTNDAGCSTESNLIVVASDVTPVDAQIAFVPSVCHGAAGVQLDATPAGGTFSGTNIDANGFFNAAAATYGTQTAYYTYVDSAACNAVVMDTATFEFVAPTVLDITVLENGGGLMDHLCFGTVYTLSAIPPGGVFSSTVGTINGSDFVVLIDSVSGADTIPVIISYEYTDGNNCTSITSDTLLAGLCLSLNAAQSFYTNVYPNPTDDHITLTLEPSTNPFTLDVINCTGQIMMQREIPVGVSTENVSLKHLPDGVYILKLSNENGTAYAKAVKAAFR